MPTVSLLFPEHLQILSREPRRRPLFTELAALLKDIEIKSIVDQGGGMLLAEQLKEKQRSIRQHFPENLGLRVHRAISWLIRASQEPDDPDVAFVLLWISFNACYAEDNNWSGRRR